MSSSTELEPVGATSVAAITDGEFNTLFRMARALAASNMFRDSRQAEQAFARILLGRDLGLSPTESMSAIHIVEGKPELSADLQASMLRTYRGPDGERYDFRAQTADDECSIEIKRREPGGEWEVVGEETFTAEDAQRAGLLNKDVYRKYPRNMLFARAISNAIAFHCPEVAHAPRLTATVEHLLADVGDAVEVPEPEPIVPPDVVVEEPGRLSQAQHRHLCLLLEDLNNVDEEARFLEALDIVGSPESDDLALRIANLDENQATDLLMRLRQPRGAR